MYRFDKTYCCMHLLHLFDGHKCTLYTFSMFYWLSLN
jgi:hypothetical protein